MINRAPRDFLTPDMADFSVRVADWFEKLRDNICGQFETIESDAEDSPLSDKPSGHFERKNWTRDGGGGGAGHSPTVDAVDSVAVDAAAAALAAAAAYSASPPDVTPQVQGDCSLQVSTCV